MLIKYPLKWRSCFACLALPQEVRRIIEEISTFFTTSLHELPITDRTE